VTVVCAVREKEILSRVVRELKKYKALKVNIECKREQLEHGINEDLFPKILDNELQNKMIFNQIEKALNESLDCIERKIIEMKYLSSERQNDLNIYLELGLQKTPYYEKKKTAIFQLARSMGML
jgi:ArpU family phage transcriptional regulator